VKTLALRNIILSILALSAFFAPAANDSSPGQTVTSLAPVSGPGKAPGPAGFIQRWTVLEPIPCSGQVSENASRATFKTEFFPNQLTVVPRDGDKVTVKGTDYIWHSFDTKNYNFNLYHFGYILHKRTDNVIFWAITVINCPEDMNNVRLAIGSNSSSMWWVNSQEVTSVYGDIQTIIDDGVSKRINLKKGANIVRAAVINNAGATDFCARFIDEQGNPVNNFTVGLTDAAN
jgi:hypothetical protein